LLNTDFLGNKSINSSSYKKIVIGNKLTHCGNTIDQSKKFDKNMQVESSDGSHLKFNDFTFVSEP